MKSNIKSIIWLIVIFAVIMAAVSLFMTTLKDNEEFGYSDLVYLLEEDLVTSFEVDGNLSISITSLVYQLDENGNKVLDANGNPLYKKDSKGENETEKFKYQLSYNFQLEQINKLAEANYLNENGNLKHYDYEEPAQTPWWQVILPYVILFVILGVFYAGIRRRIYARSFQFRGVEKSPVV